MGILEAESIKHAEMKEKKKNTTGERENFTKPNYMHKSHRRVKYHGYLPRKLHGTILKLTREECQQMDQRTRIIHDYAFDLTLPKIRRLNASRKEGEKDGPTLKIAQIPR